jgi:undecaprenyl-diphosphatase
MIVGGVIAGQGQIEVVPLIGLVWVCAVAGDVTSFILGRRLGRAFLVKHGRKVAITEERMVQVEVFFERHGGKAIFLGRFVGLVRSIAPFLVGSTGMSLRRFLPYDILGAGLWSSTFVLIGFVFWRSFDRVVEVAEQGALALGSVIAIVVGLVAAARWLRMPANRRRAGAWLDHQARRRAVAPFVRAGRPVVHALAGPARFVRHRLMPGDLGLEASTLLAVLTAGTFVAAALAGRVGPGSIPRADLRALDAARDLQTPVAVDVAEILTVLGSLPVAPG